MHQLYICGGCIGMTKVNPRKLWIQLDCGLRCGKQRQVLLPRQVVGRKSDDGFEPSPQNMRLPSNGIFAGFIDSLSRGSSMTAWLMRSRPSLFRYTATANDSGGIHSGPISNSGFRLPLSSACQRVACRIIRAPFSYRDWPQSPCHSNGGFNFRSLVLEPRLRSRCPTG